ncbi:hypothetical protein ALC56_14155 [Trachymyrmex septentrionalis]|uniref:Uncharacterized protein n=1 Tax=Trachymyrmex septentrionalis TaxID=34720 RepID=A0A195ETR8_9HYME|nr:hypothetical protein ALC56_14155 [Trachymyrmex septentrionalis]
MSAPAGPLSPRDNTRHGMRFAPGVLGAVHPTAGANNITTVVKMPIADSTRDIRYMSPQADSRRMAWSRKPTRKSQRAQLRVSQSESIDL